MKKFIVIFIIISSLAFFNKTIISKVIIFTLSKKIDRNIYIKNINIDYSKKKITLTSIEVKSNSKIYYKNINERIVTSFLQLHTKTTLPLPPL